MENDVLEKLKVIRSLAEKKQWRTAYKQFSKLSKEDFPTGLEIKMSHGIRGDVDNWLYFTDHDWGDDEWCIKFLNDMISSLEEIKSFAVSSV